MPKGSPLRIQYFVSEREAQKVFINYGSGFLTLIIMSFH